MWRAQEQGGPFRKHTAPTNLTKSRAFTDMHQQIDEASPVSLDIFSLGYANQILLQADVSEGLSHAPACGGPCLVERFKS